MASKMLVNQKSKVVFCVPCANLTEAMEDQARELKHVTDVGDAVCSVCGFAISALPEPPVYSYDVVLEVRCTLYMEASSPIEVETLAKEALTLSGKEVRSYRFDWRDSKIVD